MITGELKSKIDRIWDAMWSGGVSNPLSVIEQLTYLLFIKRLDELHTLKERKAARTGKAIEEPVFTPDQDGLRWSRFKETAPDYDLSLNRYKEVVHEVVEHDSPQEILERLATLEEEIARGRKELEAML